MWRGDMCSWVVPGTRSVLLVNIIIMNVSIPVTAIYDVNEVVSQNARSSIQKKNICPFLKDFYNEVNILLFEINHSKILQIINPIKKYFKCLKF